jgi:hypothetical protein
MRAAMDVGPQKWSDIIVLFDNGEYSIKKELSEIRRKGVVARSRQTRKIK